mgnify:CR=1 FL=1
MQYLIPRGLEPIEQSYYLNMEVSEQLVPQKPARWWLVLTDHEDGV